MDVLKLLQDCIKTFNLDVSNLRDIAFAICTADKMDGTNKRELDVDKFVESDTELSWNEVLQILGIEPQTTGCTALPRVQKLRVISDVLTLSVKGIDGLCLTCKSSRKVAKIVGVSIDTVLDYADEDDCYKNLEKIESFIKSSSIDFSELGGIYSRLCIYSEKIVSISDIDLTDGITNLPIPSSIFKSLGKKYPDKDFIDYLESRKFNIEDYSAYIVDLFCYELVQKVAKLLNKRYERNEIEFNLILTRLNSYGGSYLPIGTYSLNGYTHRLSVLRNVRCYLSRKVNIVFSENSTFSEMTILGCISLLLFLRKTNIKLEDFNKEMEGLLNECRK